MSLTRSNFLRASLLGAAGLATGPFIRAARAAIPAVVHIATEAAFPPFNMQSPDGKIIGFEPDMVAEIARRSRLNCVMVSQAWDGMIAGLTGGKYEAVCDSISITPKREQVIAFTVPYTTGSSGFAVMKDGGPVLPGNGTQIVLDDDAATKPAVAALAKALSGKILGVQVATIQNDFLTKYLKDSITIRTYASGPDVYLDLTNGRIDALMASSTNIAAFVKRSKGDMIRTGFTFTGGVLGLGSAIGLRQDEVELKAAFDTALTGMIKDGTLRGLSMKWFGTDITPAA
ncbi:transporter substrate-binding domain-containing protein [Acidisoma cellulosilytica]|uniref:Transporter substrate-binding domain-containing protein n=1 Tax=Acidisoma cellulosilyticum TaxID=2802395 RepID=A0A963Z3I5_9PROT|nr:transporter substrate-binding domain-containing protein [Acidisoma cellulosilyticum]MCB8882145.1 transporter substrate-binding domain-containing protein [Acidisoma cellulosilyticum]